MRVIESSRKTRRDNSHKKHCASGGEAGGSPFHELRERLAVESLGLQTRDLAGTEKKREFVWREGKLKPDLGCGSCAAGGRITASGFPRSQGLSLLHRRVGTCQQSWQTLPQRNWLQGTNERTISELRQGLLISTTLSTLIRIIFRPNSLSPTQLSFWVHFLSHVPSTLIARYLARVGEPKRANTGALISPGEDLNQSGGIAWCFNVIYTTCERALNSSIATLQTMLCRGVPSWECNNRREVLVASHSRKLYLSTLPHIV